MTARPASPDARLAPSHVRLAPSHVRLEGIVRESHVSGRVFCGVGGE